MGTNFMRPLEHSAFSTAQVSKRDLCTGAQLFVGLNCFERGQTQAIHTHAGADKFYFVLSGKARMSVGDETRVAESGDLIWAPAGIPHGVVDALERTVMLIALAPPPHPRQDVAGATVSVDAPTG